MDRAELLNDAEEAMRLVLDGRQSTIWTAIPGIIQNIDYDAMTCEVQPTIQGVIQDDTGASQSVDLPLLVDVPIVFPGGGGYIITLPLIRGDEVLVVFASRCIDAWWQSGGVQRPMEARMHDLSDGFAIPGPRSKPKATPIASNALQIRKNDSTAIIEISANGTIRLLAGSGVDIVGTVINITGTVALTGALNVTGEVTANGIPLSTHLHSGVTPGPGSTGPPIP